MTWKQERRRRQLLGDLKETRRKWKLKKKAPACTLWRTRYGRGFGRFVRQSAQWAKGRQSDCTADARDVTLGWICLYFYVSLRREGLIIVHLYFRWLWVAVVLLQILSRRTRMEIINTLERCGRTRHWILLDKLRITTKDLGTAGHLFEILTSQTQECYRFNHYVRCHCWVRRQSAFAHFWTVLLLFWMNYSEFTCTTHRPADSFRSYVRLFITARSWVLKCATSEMMMIEADERSPLAARFLMGLLYRPLTIRSMINE